ncbi:MAG TPA: protein-glutamate O-methyltransferase CheR [Polyangiaceae bacterium]|nr:protein-glutamate O-methyltransferase CheR [Polyangiaceae bacterium]
MTSRRELPAAAESCGDIEAPAAEPTDAQFEALRGVIRRTAGIHLGDSKKALLRGRLARRLRELGLRSFGDYLRVVRADPDERDAMIDRITTNETSFFREPGHFAYLAETLLPAWQAAANAGTRRREVRMWSAGCSTGEEPYSLAMTLLDRLGPEQGWSVEILATDVSTRVLEVAREATWPIDRAREIPQDLARKFMLRGFGTKAGVMRAAPELRRVVRVERLNLSAEGYAVGAPFDVIFCRNVLIYFDAEQKERVVGRLAACLATDGHLFVGHAESIRGPSALTCVRPTVYAAARTARSAKGAP